MIGEALDIVRKGGAVVVTALGVDDRRDADAADGDVHAVPEAAAGQPLRRGQPARRHPATAEPVPRGQAAARRDGHRRVQAQRHQRGLRRHAGGPQHPRRRHPRPLMPRVACLLSANVVRAVR